MTLLDDIINHGTTDADYHRTRPNHINCVDGFRVSVIAGHGAYCSPRPDWPWGYHGADSAYAGPYHCVEVGFPSARPEPWDQWREWCESPDDPTGTVYGYVPVEAVRALVALHGGEIA